MVATIDEKMAARVRKFAFLYILDPGAIDADRNIMFCFARYGTGMTANTLALIDYESVFRHKSLSASSQLGKYPSLLV
jgi:hypothetical protein